MSRRKRKERQFKTKFKNYHLQVIKGVKSGQSEQYMIKIVPGTLNSDYWNFYQDK